MSATDKSKNMKADVVVIGGGGAGMAAAAAAAEKGASVVLLEKRGLGGSSALAFGIFGADSPVQARAGAVTPRDECFKIAMEWAQWKINPLVVRAFINKSGDTVRWLEEQGVEFDEKGFRPGQFATVHSINGRGTALIKALAQTCRERGAEIVIRTPAKRILMSKKGEVTGVIAEKDGKEFTIDTRCIVIATGGFAGNNKLMKQYCPDWHEGMEIIGIPHTGDGLLMAQEAGAATEGMGSMLLGMPRVMHPPYDEPDDLEIPPSLRKMGMIMFATDPHTMHINNRGKRFLDESIGFGSNAIVRQPGNVCFSIFDSKFINIAATMDRPGPPGPPGGAKPTAADLEQYFRAKLKKGVITICNSLDELAEWMKIDPAVFKATIDEYNGFCEKGYDAVFNKDKQYLLPVSKPPFYAIKWSASCLNTMGGIKINENTEVLNKDDYPIPGLYAAGVDTGGSWESPTYCMKISGHAFGWSVVSGRIAGENAAEYGKNREKGRGISE